MSRSKADARLVQSGGRPQLPPAEGSPPLPAPVPHADALVPVAPAAPSIPAGISMQHVVFDPSVAQITRMLPDDMVSHDNDHPWPLDLYKGFLKGICELQDQGERSNAATASEWNTFVCQVLIRFYHTTSRKTICLHPLFPSHFVCESSLALPAFLGGAGGGGICSGKLLNTANVVRAMDIAIFLFYPPRNCLHSPRLFGRDG